MKVLIALMAIVLPALSQAGSFTGNVQKIDIHSDHWNTYDPTDLGFLSLYIEGMPVSCGQSNGLNRVVITTDHPLFESVLSVALTAKATASKLKVHYLDTCNTRDAAWDFGYISFP